MSSLCMNRCAELPVLCEMVCGRALPLFLVTGALRERVREAANGSGRLGSVCCVLGAEVMMWLSIHTECRAW